MVQDDQDRQSADSAVSDAFDSQALLMADRGIERRLLRKELLVLAATVLLALALIGWHRFAS